MQIYIYICACSILYKSVQTFGSGSVNLLSLMTIGNIILAKSHFFPATAMQPSQINLRKFTYPYSSSFGIWTSPARIQWSMSRGTGRSRQIRTWEKLWQDHALKQTGANGLTDCFSQYSYVSVKRVKGGLEMTLRWVVYCVWCIVQYVLVLNLCVKLLIRDVQFSTVVVPIPKNRDFSYFLENRHKSFSSSLCK